MIVAQSLTTSQSTSTTLWILYPKNIRASRCTMGRKYSPAYTDIYMADWNASAFKKRDKLPYPYLIPGCFKETDQHALLYKSSHHPRHTFKGLIKSQLIRFYHICTRKEEQKRPLAHYFQPWNLGAIRFGFSGIKSGVFLLIYDWTYLYVSGFVFSSALPLLLFCVSVIFRAGRGSRTLLHTCLSSADCQSV